MQVLSFCDVGCVLGIALEGRVRWGVDSGDPAGLEEGISVDVSRDFSGC
jgi:hypothetical protein